VSLLEIDGLRTEIATREGRVHAVDGVSLTVDAGEAVGLVGESGSGKTMTGMSVMRLLPKGGSITGGSVRFDGRELTALDEAGMRRLRGNDIALISQDPMSSLNPVRTIGSQLREAYRIHAGGSRLAASKRAAEVLAMVGMPRPAERLDDYPYQFSGGMRQRAMIAIGLVCEPKLLIADEPTTALDVSIQAQILELIDRLRTELSMGVLLITHDMGVIAGHTDRVAVMYAGKVVEQAATATLSSPCPPWSRTGRPACAPSPAPRPGSLAWRRPAASPPAAASPRPTAPARTRRCGLPRPGTRTPACTPASRPWPRRRPLERPRPPGGTGGRTAPGSRCSSWIAS
jgi:peptide/nickel transport system ATP-binding protein